MCWLLKDVGEIINYVSFKCMQWLIFWHSREILVRRMLQDLIRFKKYRFVKWSLQWRHNERDGVSNHQRLDCLLNRLFKVQIKENIKAPRHWPLCREFAVDRWIPPTKGQNHRKCFHVMTSSRISPLFATRHHQNKCCRVPWRFVCSRRPMS